ncbi:MAG: hypothetical protein NTU45_04165 [Planctomycetota bacterium]|jgi:hypothetical protein|nr:hypothetical protein [Planctomycetota bacterium]
MNTLPRTPEFHRMHAICAALLAACALTPNATAAITRFNNNEAGWRAAAGTVTTIDFVDDNSAPPGGIENIYYDRYASLGVRLDYPFGFPSDFDHSIPFWRRYDSTVPGFGTNLRDNGGLMQFVNALNGTLTFRFDQPIRAFAILPTIGGTASMFSLFREGQWLGSKTIDGPNQNPYSHRGIYSDEPFDEVRLISQSEVDNIYFQTVPAPGVLAAIAIAMPMVGRRRRRGC